MVLSGAHNPTEVVRRSTSPVTTASSAAATPATAASSAAIRASDITDAGYGFWLDATSSGTGEDPAKAALQMDRFREEWHDLQAWR